MKSNRLTIVVKNITKKFFKKKSYFAKSSSSVEALKDVTLTLDNAKIYGLVGESGSGKTTLARIIVGLIQPDKGAIHFNDTPVVGGVQKDTLRGKTDFQLVFQNPYMSLDPRFRIYKILAEGLMNKRTAKKRIGEKVRCVVNEVNLGQDVINKYPHELSGGERQRVALARALIVEPKVLLLDEPISSLDVSVQASILLLIEKIVRSRSLIVLFISHDLAVMRQIADYVYVLSGGVIVEHGAIDRIFKNPAQPYTKMLLNAALYK